MTVLVEGFSADALAVATHLVARGEAVLLAGPGPAPAAAAALRERGVEVRAADLDAAAPPVDVAYLDAWTPEASPRVARLRRASARISSIGDLVLERASAPVVGVTGTAGKTTTTGLLTHLLVAAGIPVLASDASPSGNRWPDAALLDGADAVPADGRLVVELTSSHLAFMSRSPAVAVVTTFWPDHVELHGSVAAYRAAKERLVRFQGPGDAVVLDASSAAVAAFAGSTPAAPWWFASGPVPAGCDPVSRLEGGAVVLQGPKGVVRAALPRAEAFRGARAVNAVAACAAALAAGADTEAVAAALGSAPAPPFRARELGVVAGVRVIDDGMAATPAKARATLAGLPDRSAVLLLGGDDSPAWGVVHASREERVEQLAAALDEVARAARAVVAFGSAAAGLAGELGRRGVDPVIAGTLADAVPLALDRLRGAAVLVLAPMFPVPAADRAAFAGLVRAAVDG